MYAIDRNGALLVAGKVKLTGNYLALTFRDDVLELVGAGQARPFMLVSADHLHTWPGVPAHITDQEKEAVVWANPRGKTADRRPCVWRGWVIHGGLALLVPEVPCGKLVEHEPKQDGFLRSYRKQPRQARSLDNL
jgi:hypothetical protein